jgi:hypothetical protein
MAAVSASGARFNAAIFARWPPIVGGPIPCGCKDGDKSGAISEA